MTVTDTIFGEFERGLAGHVVDSDNLTMQEPIGEGSFIVVLCWLFRN